MKSPLYWVAQTSSDLELLRGFPEVHDNAGGVGQSELETQLQEAKQQRQDDSILSEATNSHLNLSIQHFIHEIQLQTAASSAGVRKSRTLVLARMDKRRYY